MNTGAICHHDGICEFTVWAPFLKSLKLKVISPRERIITMEMDRWGYWRSTVKEISPDTGYLYILDDEKERPDPASHFQPEGVHGPSQVVDHGLFRWEDSLWKGISPSQMIIYEIHVGTFTPEGTFEAIKARLDALIDLGINTIELMPVAQFPGKRNWGYDGVYPFAVQNSYGGPYGLKGLVNECHKRGLAVILDVVYNHLGPEGNYLRDYGPYFTDKYRTPWGSAINFDDAFSDGVRDFFIENAIHWFKNYHIDALRLDAVHAIYDMGARHILEELSEKVRVFSEREGRMFYLIAESDLNDSRLIKPRELGGYGVDAQWSDDFHHSLHCLLTGERDGYYMGFGRVEHLVKALSEGFVYSGRYSLYRRRRHGNSSRERPARQFIVSSQNHDQVGNRMLGERLSALVSFESLKLAAAVVLLSPYIPLLFMGEEYGEEAPFLYFVSHSDTALIRAVREGRKEEFGSFNWDIEPPDPQSEETFLRSKIRWDKRDTGKHGLLLGFYREVIRLRREVPALSTLNKELLDICGYERERLLLMRRWSDGGRDNMLLVFNFNTEDVKLPFTMPEGRWRKVIDSSEDVWGGPGSSLPDMIPPDMEMIIRGRSFVLYEEVMNG